MVPKNWQIGSLSDLADTVMGYAFKSADFTPFGIPLLRMGNLYQNTLDFERSPVFLPTSYIDEYKRFVVKPGDLVMSMTGTMGKRDYGFTVEIPKNSPESLLNQRVMKFVPNDKTSPGFLLNLLRSEIILSRLYSFPGGTKQANLSANQVQDLPVPIPPLPEQKKIAQILSTWDKAITTIEQLLTNSQTQKKALMQQLLTGKIRMLDRNSVRFVEEWKDTSLGEIAEITTGTSKSKFVSNNGHNFIIDMGSVSREGKLTPSKRTNLESDFLEVGQLVMPKDDIGGGNIIGRVGMIMEANRFVLADHVYAFKVTENDSLFIGYLINSHRINKSLRRKANGTAQLGLGKKDVMKQVITIPSAVEEQQKIASVLHIADQNISVLQSTLQGLKQEKMSLMQQLLTGKRRVKTEPLEEVIC